MAPLTRPSRRACSACGPRARDDRHDLSAARRPPAVSAPILGEGEQVAAHHAHRNAVRPLLRRRVAAHPWCLLAQALKRHDVHEPETEMIRAPVKEPKLRRERKPDLTLVPAPAPA